MIYDCLFFRKKLHPYFSDKNHQQTTARPAPEPPSTKSREEPSNLNYLDLPQKPRSHGSKQSLCEVWPTVIVMATTDIRQCKHIGLMSVEKATNSVWTTSAGWSPLRARESIEPIDGLACQWSSGLMGWTPAEGEI
ncbi:hypothetical protein CDAR_614341 [Caerostris darwini]|uniref:Uncharacterized protein n=1 Tax=Caerostris darwini TaxID=1538125 RepID=A0AAV4MG54_9ARAC|nr:hypothetical protein CDAR_614341 [Caerostris darwini]